MRNNLVKLILAGLLQLGLAHVTWGMDNTHTGGAFLRNLDKAREIQDSHPSAPSGGDTNTNRQGTLGRELKQVIQNNRAALVHERHHSTQTNTVRTSDVDPLRNTGSNLESTSLNGAYFPGPNENTSAPTETALNQKNPILNSDDIAALDAQNKRFYWGIAKPVLVVAVVAFAAYGTYKIYQHFKNKNKKQKQLLDEPSESESSDE